MVRARGWRKGQRRYVTTRPLGTHHRCDPVPDAFDLGSTDAIQPDGGKLTIEVANVALDDGMPRAIRKWNLGNMSCSRSRHRQVHGAATSMRASIRFLRRSPVGKALALALPKSMACQTDRRTSENLHEVTRARPLSFISRDLALYSQPRQAAALALTAPETVLLVYDEKCPRDVASMLESLGYEAAHGIGGVEALSILEMARRSLCCSRTIVMPGSNQWPQTCRTGGWNKSIRRSR